MNIAEVIVIHEEPIEYTCADCKQLRLSLKGIPTECGNCGSVNITTGVPGSLERPK